MSFSYFFTFSLDCIFPYFWFCIFPTLGFSIGFHLWVCSLVWLLSFFFCFLFLFFSFFWWMWISLCLPVWLILLLPFVLGFCLSFFVCSLVWFPPLYYSFTFPFCAVWFVKSWCSSKGSGQHLQTDKSTGHWTTRELPTTWNINWQELSQKPPSQH